MKKFIACVCTSCILMVPSCFGGDITQSRFGRVTTTTIRCGSNVVTAQSTKFGRVSTTRFSNGTTIRSQTFGRNTISKITP